MAPTDQAHPAGQRRRADAERSIAAILDTARDLFAKGANPNMSEIARAAGVGRMTLYAHFPSRDTLIEAVVERAITETNQILDTLSLDTEPADKALARIIATSWPILDRHRRLRTAALAELGPEPLRRHHDQALPQLERVIARGRRDGTFRADLPGDWLVTTFYAVLHAAADEANAGRLTPPQVPGLVTATILSAFRPAAT
jgi:TetR/AcrR family transcriptional repressor of mexCD-oprJ operon